MLGEQGIWSQLLILLVSGECTFTSSHRLVGSSLFVCNTGAGLAEPNLSSAGGRLTGLHLRSTGAGLVRFHLSAVRYLDAGLVEPHLSRTGAGFAGSHLSVVRYLAC